MLFLSLPRIEHSGIELENPNPDHVGLGKRGCFEVGLFCNAFEANTIF